MQNSLQSDEKPKSKRAKEKLKYFFKETFRPHTKEEYAEVFTRGLNGNCRDDIERKLPWLYIRVFALNLILFALIAFSFKLARYSADYQTAILLGGLLFNIPLFMFFFELYPKRDLSLLKLVAVLLIGGVLSTAIVTLGYKYIYSTTNEPNAWLSTLWVGFWEELIKGAVAIAAIFVLGKKNPLYCFLIGFAVGTGFSLTEDLGYNYSMSYSYGIVLTSLGRGLSCVCSHAPWTAMISWAFAKFRKPFLNFRFYGIAVAMMALHYFADVPFFDDNLDILRGVTFGWAIEAGVVAAIFTAVFFVLKSCFKELYAEGKPEIYQPEPITESTKISHIANITAVLCGVALSVFALAGYCVKVGNVSVYDKIYDDNELIEYMQDGLSLHADLKREFDDEGEIYSEFISEGKPKGVTKKFGCEDEGEYEYFYVYYFDEQDLPHLQSVGVKVDNKLYYLNQIVVYEDYYYDYQGYPTNYRPVDDSSWGVVDDEDEPPTDPEEPEEPEEPVEEPKPIKVVSFFNVKSVNYSYSMEEGYYKIFTGETEFKGLGAIIALSVLAGATLIGGSAAFITLKIKARRNKDA